MLTLLLILSLLILAALWDWAMLGDRTFYVVVLDTAEAYRSDGLGPIGVRAFCRFMTWATGRLHTCVEHTPHRGVRDER